MTSPEDTLSITTAAPVPLAPLAVIRPRKLTCTCCAGPETRWFAPGNCAKHPNISADGAEVDHEHR